MIDTKDKNLSVRKQCDLLGLRRSSFYYKPRIKMDNQSEYLKEVEMGYLKYPIYGYRRMNKYLCSKNFASTEKKARNAMKRSGLCAIYPKPKLSVKDPDHDIYPYLLQGLEIKYPNHVWSTDITYLRLNGNFVYLTAIIDIFSRKVLSWKISNSMDNSFCIETLSEAISKYGKPDIFNTDQGSQYTSRNFTNILKKNKIKISMDGKGRALDNVYIERLWRSLKYENIFLNEYQTIKELRKGVQKYFDFYNGKRFHQALGYSVPNEIYFAKKKAV